MSEILTRRQAEIAHCVARGLTSREISDETGLALPTVNQHIVDAAARLQGDGRPRHKLTLWFFHILISDDTPPA